MNKELNNLIASLSEDNFRKLIQSFLKEKYKTSQVRIIDGPYDGGNDLEIFVGDKEIKRNIQVTVQKTNFENKLIKDLQKAKDNIDKYSYLSNFDFYISQNIGKDKTNELKLKAEVDYGINLIIYDANKLSQLSSEYSSINEFTYEAHNIKTNNDFIVADKQTKILYDVLTLNHNSIEIKKNFINSYIFSFLYANPESSLDNIFDYINPHLNNSLNKDYIEKELNNLKSKNFLVTPISKKQFSLSVAKFNELNEIFANVASQENELKTKVDTFIEHYNINCECTELIAILYKLYQDNYTIDIEEIKSTNNSFSASIKKNFNDLISFFTKKGVDSETAKSASKELLKTCQENDYLNKLSSTHLFNNLYSSDKFEKYINNKSQNIFVDTQILIRLICVLYNDKIDYKDIALQSVKLLLKTFRKFRDKINLVSSYDYVGEVSGHLYEAYKLQRFLRLPFVSKLGKSKNVFYNTYVELRSKDLIDEELEFSDFIEELLDVEIDSSDEQEFLAIAQERISGILEQLNIELIYHHTYPNYPQIRKAYEISLAYQSRERSYIARENDLRTILYLSTKQNYLNEENGNVNEPFLITWDSAFYDFRKQLMREHKELKYWYIYSPLKLVDRLSVMNFQLNPQSISLNIVALTETNFNYSTKTTSFLDVISSFFNAKDVDQLSIIHKLSRLKDSTHNINEIPNNEEIKNAEDDKLTNILLDLKNHYTSYNSKFKFNEIIQIFEIPKYENEIIKILGSSLENYKVGETINYMICSFDNLIIDAKK